MKTQPTTTQGKSLLTRVFLLFILAILSPASLVWAQTTTFTYQGRFTDGGTAANGIYDMQFKLFDSPSVGAGNQISSTITNGAVTVNSGVFTVQLDFGASGFSGADRFLEIGVRLSGDANPYTVLAPRQPLTSAVYAIRAGSTTTADTATTATTATNATQLGGVAASQYVQTNDSRLTDARSPSAGSSDYIQNSLNAQAANFNISGNGKADTLTASNGYYINSSLMLILTPGNNIAPPTLHLAPSVPKVEIGGSLSVGNNLSAEGSVSFGANLSAVGSVSANQYNIGVSRVLSIPGINNTFVGNNTGTANTSGRFNSFLGTSAGAANTVGYENSFFGVNAGAKNNDGFDNSFFGVNAGSQNSSGQNNSFFGFGAGNFNTSGTSNSYFGKYAGFGFGAGGGITGSANSFFGAGTGFSNTASGNSFFGSQAGESNTTGASNSFFGNNAGQSNTIGSNNTVVGYSADLGSNNLSNATAIGSDALVTQNNSLVLGSIKGVGSATADTKVGIGTSAPNERLTIKTATSNYGWVHTDGTITIGSYVGGSGNGGYLGTKSNHPLHFFVNDGGPSMTIETTGTVRINTLSAGGNIQLCRNAANQISLCSSSLRYKTNIQPFIGGLSILNRLRPITFDWKQGGMHDLGFGAEDIAAVEPLLVNHNDKGEVEGVKYDRISAVLVNAVKEQQQQISQQQEQIKLQQSEVESLKRLVCQRNRRAAVCK